MNIYSVSEYVLMYINTYVSEYVRILRIYEYVRKNTYINTYEYLQYLFVCICFKYVQNTYM